MRNFGLVQAEFLVIDWESRPPRKPRTTDQGYDRHAPSDQYGTDAQAETSSSSTSEDAQPRTLLTRDNELSGSADASLAVASEDAALMASPSGTSLGRRRTDTMYLADDLALAALDSVLSGEADVSTLEYDPTNKEASKDDTELEMVESVDPFKDENEVSLAGDAEVEPQTIPDDVVITGDDISVPDVEDVVVPAEPADAPEDIEEDVSWPDAEELDKEAAEASEAGQIREDVVLEPLPTPATEDPSEAPADAEGEEEKASAGEEASAALPEDVDAVDVMLKTLEEERKVKLEALTGSPPVADVEL